MFRLRFWCQQETSGLLVADPHVEQVQKNQVVDVLRLGFDILRFMTSPKAAPVTERVRGCEGRDV